MKKIEVNAKGLACPQPVVLTKKAFDDLQEGEILVLVDSDVARDNVVRLARNQGYTSKVENKMDGVQISIVKHACILPASEQKGTAPAQADEEIVYLFDSDYIGTNMELGKVLVNGFLNAILSLPHSKGAVILISNGVRLATDGSYALEVLSKISDKGFTILICGTCLDFFKIRSNVRVGTVSNAIEILERMTKASKTIKF